MKKKFNTFSYKFWLFRPPIRWIRSLPSMSLCRCLCQRNDGLKSLTHKLTGATGILIFYSILPEKTLTLYPNKSTGLMCCGRRGSAMDLPREILDSAKVAQFFPFFLFQYIKSVCQHYTVFNKFNLKCFIFELAGCYNRKRGSRTSKTSHWSSWRPSWRHSL